MKQGMCSPHKQPFHLLTVLLLEEILIRIETLLLLCTLLPHLLHLELHLEMPTSSLLYLLGMQHHLLHLKVASKRYY